MAKSVKSVLVLAGSLLAMAPALAGGNGGGGCASATTSVRPYTINAGEGVGINTFVTNCSGGKERYTVEHTFTSACGVTSPISSATYRFSPNYQMQLDTSWAAPTGTCSGTGTVNVKVSSGGSVLATARTPLTIR